MIRLMFLFMAISIVKSTEGQIEKRNWLVGGTGLFNSNAYTNDLGNKSWKESNIQFQPNIGYFFADRVAGGIKLNLAFSRVKVVSENYNLQKNNSYGIGPFVRYYILKNEGRLNFLIEGSYQYQLERGGIVQSDDNTPAPVPISQSGKNTFAVAGGPVIFFNTTVGLEFLAGYSFTDYVQNKGNIKNFYMGMGLQIYLGKE